MERTDAACKVSSSVCNLRYPLAALPSPPLLLHVLPNFAPLSRKIALSTFHFLMTVGVQFIVQACLAPSNLLISPHLLQRGADSTDAGAVPDKRARTIDHEANSLGMFEEFLYRQAFHTL